MQTQDNPVRGPESWQTNASAPFLRAGRPGGGCRSAGGRRTSIRRSSRLFDPTRMASSRSWRTSGRRSWATGKRTEAMSDATTSYGQHPPAQNQGRAHNAHAAVLRQRQAAAQGARRRVSRRGRAPRHVLADVEGATWDAPKGAPPSPAQTPLFGDFASSTRSGSRRPW